MAPQTTDDNSLDFRPPFEAAPGLFLVLLPDAPRYTIVACSDAYARATLTRREELVGRGLFEVFPDDPAAADATGVRNLGASLARVISTRAPDTMAHQLYPIRRPPEAGGGFEERWWSPANHPVLGRDGQVTHIIHRVEDVTESVRREQASKEELGRSAQQLEMLFEGSPDGIFIAGPDGLYTDVNAAGCRLLGYARHELLGRSIAELVPPDELARQSELRRHILAGGVEMSEWRLRRKDGTYVPVELSSSALPDGRLLGFVRDITKRRMAEDAVRLSEAKLSGIVALSADAIISVDEDQRITLFNEGAEKIFGYSKAEPIGSRLDILLPDRHRAIHRQRVEQFASGQVKARQMGERSSTIMGRRKSGEEFPADASISKIEVGGTRLLTVALRDITDRKRIENEARLLAEAGRILVTAGPDSESMLTEVAKLIISTIADWCSIDLVHDGQLRRTKVIHSDPAKAAICEAMERYPVHRRRNIVSEVVQSQRALLMSEVPPGYLETITQSAEHLQLLRGLDPSSFVIVPLVARGQSLGTLAFGASHGSRRYGDSDVRLAEELASRAALALDTARLHASLERAVGARDEVLGVVAHDLRNPLNSINLSAQLLERRFSREGAVENKKVVESIRSAARRANRLIEDLLDVTRIEAGQLSIELGPFSADQLILDVVEQQQLLASTSSIELRSQVEGTLPEIWGDSNRCLQVLENLIGNALRFTPPGGRVTVGATPVEGEVRFWVADTGAGIAPADLPHVFERFWKAKKTERSGAGLGLQICKGLVESHGGRIWVESALGCGTTFHFTVPTAQAVAELRQSARTAHQSVTPPL